MQEVAYSAGEVIYREGDPGDAVYLVQSGSVEISRMAGGEVATLSVFGPGEIFGETGVLQDRPHSTTVTALSETVVLKLDKPTFLKAFGEDNPFGLPLLRMLCGRLAQADEQALTTKPDERAYARLASLSELRLLAGSSHMAKQIGEEGIALSPRDLPFTVGRQTRAAHGPQLLEDRLALFDPHTDSISQSHFVLEESDGVLAVRDLASRMGTVVNGAHLSRLSDGMSLPLRLGLNDVIAGTKESEMRFRILAEGGE